MGILDNANTLISGANALLGNEPSKPSSTIPGNTSTENILGTHWTYARNLVLKRLSCVSDIDDGSVPTLANFFNGKKDLSDLALLHALSIDTSDYTFEPLQEFTGGTWRYTSGRPNIRKFTIEFRDSQFGALYTIFKAASINLKNKYPDDQKWTIEVGIQADNYSVNTNSSGTGSTILDALVGAAGDVINTAASYVGNMAGNFVDSLFGKNGSTSTSNAGQDRYLKLNALYRNSIDSKIGSVITTKSAILESISSMRLNHSSQEEFMTFTVTFLYYDEGL